MKKYRVKKSVMQELAEIFDLLETEEDKPTKKSEHGEIVAVRFEAYCDVTVYEDGYESRRYIGD